MSTGERFQIEPLERRRLLAGAIEGVVFNDLNGNATRDATEGVWPGITVWLDTNRNRAQDAGEPSAVTDATGTYRFDGLTAGEYSVRMVEPNWSRQTSPGGGRPSFAHRESTLVPNGPVVVNVELAKTLDGFHAPGRRWTTPANLSMSIVRVARGPDRLYVYALPTNSVAHTLYEVNPVSGALIRTHNLGRWADGTVDIAWLRGRLYFWQNGWGYTYDPETGSASVTGPSSFAYGSSSFAGDSRSNELVSLAPSGRTIRYENQTTYAYREVSLAPDVPTLAQRGIAFSDGVIVGISTSSAVTSVVSIDAATGQLLAKFDWPQPEYYLSVAGDGWSDQLLSVSDGNTQSANFGLARYGGPTKNTMSRSRGQSQATPTTVDFISTGIVPGSRIRILTGDAAAPTQQLVFDSVESAELRFSLPYAFSSQWVGIEQSSTGYIPFVSDFYGVNAFGQSNVTSVTGAATRDTTPSLTFVPTEGDMLLQDGNVVYTLPPGSIYGMTYPFEVASPLLDGVYRFSLGHVEPGFTVQRNMDLPVTVDTVAPFVRSGVYERDTTTPRIVIQFSESTTMVPGTTPSFSFVNVATGVGPPRTTSFTSSSITVTPTQPLGDGRYRVRWTNRADAAGNVADIEFTFHVLAGDANDDAVVNFDDLLILAANYNQSARVFSQGDFDRNGTVNFDDLLILASRYNTSIPATVGAPPPPSVLASGDDEDGAPNDVLR